jgi:hypothetical protein
MSTSVQSVGQFNSLPDCEKSAEKFRQQGTVAACVKQQNPEEMLAVFSNFIKLMDQK